MNDPLASAILMPLLLTMALSTGCPSSCLCKWRNGKQTVECADQNLLIIPKGIDIATQVLDVAGNNFQYIQRENFLKMGLINLQKLFLSKCEIKTIDDDAFKGLTNLVELDLSGNMLAKVPTEALLNCPSLMRLNLSKNPISSLDRLAFNHLSFLTTLDVSGCEISEVHEAAFSSLYGLEWIDLSHNKIQRFPEMRFFPARLKGVQLQDNPWICDCHLQSFNFWLKQDIVPILIPPVCQEPTKLKGLPIKGLEENVLACAPEVTPTSFYFELEEGRNITLLCQVKSIPPAKVSWIFKGQVLQNNSEPVPGLRLVYFIEESDEEKESSLFIYNLNSENNSTFYCVAENSAGVTSANYTILILLKQSPVRLEEHAAFPIEIFALILAIILVSISLCFMAAIMALIKHRPITKRKKRQLKNKETNPASPMAKPTKSILKSVENRTNLYANSSEEGNQQNCQIVSEQNPDIIHGISSDQNSASGILLHRDNTYRQKAKGDLISNGNITGCKLMTHHQRDPSTISSIPATMSRRSLNRQRTEPYLKPTLTSNFRPISAPTFERYVENHDLRYTADGYPVRHDIATINRGRQQAMAAQISYSEASAPSGSMVRPDKLADRIIEVQMQTQKDDGVTFSDDVEL